jgi:spoIIIJ-associated protein
VREVERSAASVEEALEAALDELGISEQEADVEIVQEPKGGFLGLGSQGAVVRVRARNGSPAGGSEEPDEDVEQQSEVAAQFLEGFFEVVGLEAEVEPAMVEGSMYVDVWGVDSSDAMGILIGRHGQTLDALQDVVRGAVQTALGERCRVFVDVEDYRKRRRSQLVTKAQNVARRVKRTGKPEALEPMTAFDRKAVHDAVAQVGGLETASEGEEPERRVVIRRRGRVPRGTGEPRFE